MPDIPHPPDRPRRSPALAGLALLLVAGGCPARRLPVDPPPPPLAPPAAWQTVGGQAATPDRWWTHFADPALDALIETALDGNPGLRQAWARLDAAAAAVTAAGSRRLPELTGEAAGQRNRTAFYAGEALGQRNFATNIFPLSLAAGYEVDLWGRVAAQVRAAERDWQASAEDIRTAAMTLAAQLSDTWFAVVEQTAQLQLLEGQLATSRTYLQLVELRFAQGLASAVDVYQQRQQVESLLAQRPPIESRRATLRHQLDALLGRAPGSDLADSPDRLPDPPPLPETGLPADLLARRPDLRAAALRVAAHDERLAAALADRWPALRLSARTGFQGRRLPDLFRNWVYTLSSSLSVPLLDGHRRRAETDRIQAVRQEAAWRYGQLALQAVVEVEDALVQEAFQAQTIEQMDRQLATARTTLERARARYANGLSDFLPVLTALQAVQGLERNQLSARRLRLSHRIQLHRALGGDWTVPRPDPPIEPTGGTLP